MPKHPTPLEVGMDAPDFTATIETGEQVSLSDYAGKKLILFFYPKDDTPGCTKENCNLRDNYARLKEMGFELLGVSADSAEKHNKFIEKYSLPFHLITDGNKKLIEQYGVWGEKKNFGVTYQGLYRTTFVIDENSKIEAIFKSVKTGNHTEQILTRLGIEA